MIAAGLFDRVPRPDYALALHVEPELPAGRSAPTSGCAMANADSVDVTLSTAAAATARARRRRSIRS